MQCRRITRHGLAELKRSLREDGQLPRKEQFGPGWTEPHPLRADVARLASAIAALDLPQGGERDAFHAESLHRVQPLPRPVAADGGFWAWFAACEFPDYTLARWPGGESGVFFARVDRDLARNALARLWWTAEQTRVDDPAAVTAALGLPASDDPYHFTHLALEQYTIQYALSQRNLSQCRAATIAFLACLQRRPFTGDDVDELIKWVNLGLSTVVADAFEPTRDPDRPYAVDPGACARLRDYMERLTAPYWKARETPGPERPHSGPPEPEAPPRGLLGRATDWLRRRR